MHFGFEVRKKGKMKNTANHHSEDRQAKFGGLQMPVMIFRSVVPHRETARRRAVRSTS